MKPISLRMSAFGPYNKEVELNFQDLQDHQLFLIHGPTGAGKTTILDAIVYALYNKTSGAMRSGEQMRSDYADPTTKTEVSYVFAIGEDVYRIVRSPKQELKKQRGEGTRTSPAAVELAKFEDGSYRVLSTKSTDITELVHKIIGFRQDQFTQVVLLPQGDFRKLLLATSSERMQILRELFNTTIYKRMQDFLKEEYEKYAEKATELVRQEQAILVEEDVLSIEELAGKIEKLQSELSEKQETLVVKQSEKEELETRLTREIQRQNLKKQLSAQEERFSLLIGQKPEFDLKRIHLKRAKEVQQLKPLWDSLVELEETQSSYKKEIERLAHEMVHWKTVQVDVQQRRNEWNAGAKAREELQERIFFLETKRKACEAYVELIQKKEKCFAALTTLEKDIQDKEKALSKLETDYKSHGKEKAKAEGIIEKTERAEAELIVIDSHQKERLKRNQQLERLVLEETQINNQEEDLKKAMDKREEAYRMYKAMEKQFYSLQAYFLSEGLESGNPCPVCGSISHPQKPICPDEILREEDLKKVQAAYQEADSIYTRKREALANARNVFIEKKEELALLESKEPIASLEELEQCIKVLQDKIECYKGAKAAVKALSQQLMTLDEQRGSWQQAKEEDNIRLSSLKTELASLVLQIKNHEEILRVEERSLSYWSSQEELLTVEKLAYETMEKQLVEDEQVCHEKVATTTTALEKEQDNLRKLTLQLEEKGGRFQEALVAHRLDKAIFLEWLQKIVYISLWEDEIAHYDHTLSTLTGAVENLRSQLSCIVEDRLSIDTLKVRTEESKASYEGELTRIGQLQQRCQISIDKKKKLEQYDTASKVYKERAKFIGDLYGLANGVNVTGRGGVSRFTFESFVLRTILEEVLVAANIRLLEMSHNRYSLQKAELRDTSQGYQGLDLEIYDAYTGYKRDVTTLSGGETFLASLALALGMADVIQSYAGGVHLDTIFIDEGFGTLDPETLDEALETLINLQANGRLVGVISHVPELQERIEAKLTVIKTDQGSTACFVV